MLIGEECFQFQSSVNDSIATFFLQTEFHRDYVCHICGKVSANRQCHRVHVRDHFPARCDACDLR